MKIKYIVLLLMMAMQISFLSAQNAVAELHFESAEKAFNSGNYREVITKLDDTEKLTGPTSKTLYLRIVTQDKLFNGGRNYATDDFTQLSSLRENVAVYLEVMADQGLDDRYREVYRIGEGLSKFPKTAVEWQETRDKEIQQKREREEQAIAQSKAREEQAKKKELDDFIAGKITASQVRHNMVAREASENTAAENVAIVYLVRPGKFVASLATFSYYINDRDIVKLRNKQHTVMRFSPGLLQVVHKEHSQQSNTIALDLKPGTTYYVRSDAKMSGLSDLEVLDAALAKKEIEETKLIN